MLLRILLLSIFDLTTIALLGLFHLWTAFSVSLVCHLYFLAFFDTIPNSCMFNTFPTSLTSRTSSSNVLVALSKKQKQPKKTQKQTIKQNQS